MELFFLESFDPRSDTAILSADESHHAKRVLRKRSCDMLDLTDGKGHHLQGVIIEDARRELLIKITRREQVPFPPQNRIEVALAVIRPNRMDWAVEKLTELGVEKIVPVICRYNSAKNVKVDHLRKICLSALKQSEQFYLPQISAPLPLEDWMEKISHSGGLRIMCHPDKTLPQVTSWPADEQVCLAIGPEGGFHPDEIRAAKAYHFQSLNLGSTILRTETAAVAATTRIKMLANF
ncbi:MAG: RsmE family RNA methyltransferase [Calditrichia bacterium]